MKQGYIFSRLAPAVGTLLLCAAIMSAAPETPNRRAIRSDDGAVEAEATVSPDSPALSDAVRLALVVRHRPSVTVTLPDFGPRYGAFDVEHVSSPPPSISGDIQTRTMTVTLKPTAAGETRLPPIPMTVVSGENRSTLTLPAASLTVRSPNDPATASLDHLSDPRPARPKPIWPYLLAAAAVVGLVVWLSRRHARFLRVRKEAAAILSPAERARIAIDALMKSEIYRTDVRTFYLRLTGIVRRFIEETTGLRAPERTTEEFLREAEEASDWFDADDRRRLAEFLEFADLVKFAKFRPTEADIFDGADKARAFVQERPAATDENEQRTAFAPTRKGVNR